MGSAAVPDLLPESAQHEDEPDFPHAYPLRPMSPKPTLEDVYALLAEVLASQEKQTEWISKAHAQLLALNEFRAKAEAGVPAAVAQLERIPGFGRVAKTLGAYFDG